MFLGRGWAACGDYCFLHGGRLLVTLLLLGQGKLAFRAAAPYTWVGCLHSCCLHGWCSLYMGGMHGAVAPQLWASCSCSCYSSNVGLLLLGLGVGCACSFYSLDRSRQCEAAVLWPGAGSLQGCCSSHSNGLFTCLLPMWPVPWVKMLGW